MENERFGFHCGVVEASALLGCYIE